MRAKWCHFAKAEARKDPWRIHSSQLEDTPELVPETFQGAPPGDFPETLPESSQESLESPSQVTPHGS